MQAVNLLPAGAAGASRWGTADAGAAKRVLLSAAAAAGAVILVSGAGFVHTHGIVNDRQSTLDELQPKVAVAQAKATTAQAARADMQARKSAVTTVTSTRMTWEQVLRDVAKVLPGNVRLQSLQAQSPTPVSSSALATTSTTTTTTGTTPTAFVVTGFTSSQKAVARVMDRLSLLPWLSDVSLQSSTRSDTSRGSKAVQFTIGANLSSTGGK